MTTEAQDTTLHPSELGEPPPDAPVQDFVTGHAAAQTVQPRWFTNLLPGGIRRCTGTGATPRLAAGAASVAPAASREDVCPAPSAPVADPAAGALPRPGAGGATGQSMHRVGGAVRGWFRLHRPGRSAGQQPVHGAGVALHRAGRDPVHAPGGAGHAPVARTITAPVLEDDAAPGRPGAAGQRLADQWGKLTYRRGGAAVFGLRALLALISLALVVVVIAPPALSAHDILGWAQSASVDSGLGLTPNWSWMAFLALDFAAGVCVLICVYCAVVDSPSGVFNLYVWLFAGATAYANFSFGSRPGAPGDARWFFPVMSLLGPLILHSVLKFVRSRVKGAAGGVRAKRPGFPIADWLPVVGTPQETYGAWRTGTMLGIESPDQAMWAYQAITNGAGWWGRWAVRKLVRAERQAVFSAYLADERLALNIPGLVPAGAFVPARSAAVVPAEPVRGVAPRRTPRPVPPAEQPVPAVVEEAVSVVVPEVPVAASNVVDLVGARSALSKIYEVFGSDCGSWEQLFATVSTYKIETRAGVGKRRVSKLAPDAETVLPWAEAQEQNVRRTA